MALAEEDITLIRKLIHEECGSPAVRYDLELRERLVRVEEAIKHQAELMEQGFRLMERRFEQVDKRFEEMREDMNRRFEQVDKRFELLTRRIDRFMIWSFGTTLAVGGLVVALIKYLPG